MFLMHHKKAEKQWQFEYFFFNKCFFTLKQVKNHYVCDLVTAVDAM